MDIKKLSDKIIADAYKRRIEDVYILPKAEDYQLFERKGKNRTLKQNFSKEIGQQLISRFKYLGQMDIGEKRKVQSGALTYRSEHSSVNEKIRLRLSSVGDYQHRETLVIRLLYPLSDQHFRCFSTEDLVALHRYTKERGLYLFSGPVGSGKTSLMYRLAQENAEQIITVEDPVELEEAAFLQLQVNEKIHQSYEELLKLSLRHRPDLLIVGEIRDALTAQMTLRAALTGHRVFATIHARELAGILPRIEELIGYQQALIDCLKGIVYQEILPDKEQSSAVLWSYQFFEKIQEEPTKRSDKEATFQVVKEKCWQTSHLQAERNDWRSYPFEEIE